MTVEPTTNDYPAPWKWDADGNHVEGKFVSMGEAPTAGYGYRPILTLEVDGVERVVWVFHQALAEKLRDELARRQASDFDVGERIAITRGERKMSEAGRNYVPYRVSFPDAPRRSAAEILGAPSDFPEHAAEPATTTAEEDIPF